MCLVFDGPSNKQKVTLLVQFPQKISIRKCIKSKSILIWCRNCGHKLRQQSACNRLDGNNDYVDICLLLLYKCKTRCHSKQTCPVINIKVFSGIIAHLTSKMVQMYMCIHLNFYAGSWGLKKVGSRTSVVNKKSPNVYKSCPKMTSQEKLKILTPLQKLP